MGQGWIRLRLKILSVRLGTADLQGPPQLYLERVSPPAPPLALGQVHDPWQL